MAKGRVGLYQIQGETLTRTHTACPKCGPGVFLAEHQDRRSCGKCGYTEARTDTASRPSKAKAPKAS